MSVEDVLPIGGMTFNQLKATEAIITTNYTPTVAASAASATEGIFTTCYAPTASVSALSATQGILTTCYAPTASISTATITTIVGGKKASMTMVCNNFKFPAPATEFTASVSGAYLGPNTASKNCYLPIDNLMVGDVINSFTMKGYNASTGAASVTVGATLQKISTTGLGTLLGTVSNTSTTGAVAEYKAITASTVANGFHYVFTLTGSTENFTSDKLWISQIDVNVDKY